jgi:CRP/FNR family transcriptional regulator, anaerobic regulatory protein
MSFDDTLPGPQCTTASFAPLSSMPSMTKQATRHNDENQQSAQNIGQTLALLSRFAAPQRRIVHAGDHIYRGGDRFASLYVLNSGIFKVMELAGDGRELVVGLRFRGDWLGFDGMASGRHACDAVAMDTGEVWGLPYEAFVAQSCSRPELLGVLHRAMGRELARDREALMSVCTLGADARVADFLRCWAESLAQRGMRTDQITLHMTRAEIGNHLGMTLETVSRVLSRLARRQLIHFADGGRRDIRIPRVEALAEYVQSSLSPAGAHAA